MDKVERARRIDLLSKTMYEYFEYFISNNKEKVIEYFDWPVTFFTGDNFSIIKDGEWAQNVDKDYQTTIGMHFTVLDINNSSGIVWGSGTRIKKDGSILETITGIYTCKYLDNNWKIKGITGLRKKD